LIFISVSIEQNGATRKGPPMPALRSPPCRSASAAQPRRSLPRVRPGVGTDDAAPGADHARAECWHWHVIGPRVGAQDRAVVAQPTAHIERPHAVGAHVAECHRRPGIGSGSCAHAGEDTMAALVQYDLLASNECIERGGVDIRVAH
jgi:hypothetical protein